MVAVDDLAVGVHGQASVGVAVVGDAGIGTVLAHGRDEVLHVRAAAAVVDVEAVRGGVDRDDRRAGRA